MYPDGSFNANYETDDAVYFFSSAFDPLNPWSAHVVKLWGKTFYTAEHAYHYKKFATDYPDVADKIAAAPSPWAAMQVERQHGKLRRPDWHDIKLGVMTDILRATMQQNQDIQECLLKTGDKTIYKNSPVDPYWGIGEDGNGENAMGKILMQLRDELRSSASG